MLGQDDVVNQDTGYYALIESDPRLAVVGLRIDIEKRLRRIGADIPEAQKNSSIFRLMNVLEKENYLKQEETSALKDILNSLNSAAHGAEISRDTAQWVLEIGSRLLKSLDKRFPESQ